MKSESSFSVSLALHLSWPMNRDSVCLFAWVMSSISAATQTGRNPPPPKKTTYFPNRLGKRLLCFCAWGWVSQKQSTSLQSVYCQWGGVCKIHQWKSLDVADMDIINYAQLRGPWAGRCTILPLFALPDNLCCFSNLAKETILLHCLIIWGVCFFSLLWSGQE